MNTKGEVVRLFRGVCGSPVPLGAVYPGQICNLVIEALAKEFPTVRKFGIVDLFAGPGGLGEGFSVAGGETSAQMQVLLSAESQPIEVRTLRLRAFLRTFEGGFPSEYYEAIRRGRELPDWSELYPTQWAQAEKEARQLELGADGVFEEVAVVLDRAREAYHGDTILIGGPPCQAYSLVGRARNRGKVGYVPEDDKRHYLYREYVRILSRLKPAAFVMENVKGMMSSKVGGGPIFQRVLEDLSEAGDGYRLMPLAFPRTNTPPRASDFLVRAEEYGVPQARHRIFIVGLRNDVETSDIGPALLAKSPEPVTVAEALSDLPPLRSGLSRGDGAQAWRDAVLIEADKILQAKTVSKSLKVKLGALLADDLAREKHRSARTGSKVGISIPEHLANWLIDKKLDTVLHHETRGHIASDLGRYLYASVFGEIFCRSPKLHDMPLTLLPAHKNRDSGAFADRFRVQIANRPSSTITSHISKDGHYFIHPDPRQVRSLTVREAARLQTFPDNYFFCGPRTAQYHQVGNAVPPYLALQIARVIRGLLAGE